jgi:hypothetical protein
MFFIINIASYGLLTSIILKYTNTILCCQGKNWRSYKPVFTGEIAHEPQPNRDFLRILFMKTILRNLKKQKIITICRPGAHYTLRNLELIGFKK